MTDGDWPDELGRVERRACSGLGPAGVPRHPRPAGVHREMLAQYAADYGVRGADGRLAPMYFDPLLDAIAALYDGCEPCERHHTGRIAADSALTTHTVGAALLTVEEGAEYTPVPLIRMRLLDEGAVIALTMRTHGLLAAVEIAGRLPGEQRTVAVIRALRRLLPLSVYDEYLSNMYPPDKNEGRPMVSDDREALADLYRRFDIDPST